MKYFAEATFASFQICFKNHASEVWAQGVPEISDDPSALFDPSVSLNEQGQEFQSRKQTGPETAFLIDEVLLSRRDALDNWFEAKKWSQILFPETFYGQLLRFHISTTRNFLTHKTIVCIPVPTSGTRQDQCSLLRCPCCRSGRRKHTSQVCLSTRGPSTTNRNPQLRLGWSRKDAR